ncbi:H+/oligopeptide symporter [Handroanthus impetiginosus]|uniref:H+/oligopeptide symporter n=1 Tax=Handroanthus impetiginosus TaxID=429701 RepID=A0A2G9H7D9_9LAMI|nr:H+/oligopeptide symporter [Handroanthus impetiginosus]
MITGNDIPAARAPLLDDVVRASVDLNGLPARRSKSGCWKSASFIIGVEVAERFAYYGISSNMISYLTGPLGQSTAAAAENVNAWYGTALLLPLLGAFIADSFLGRYRTIIIASLLYILALGFLSLSALLHSHDSSNCKSNAYNPTCFPPLLEVIVFFFSLYLVAFAQGGHKPCVQAFGADQFDEEDEHESKARSSFFNWWYFSMNGGVLVAQLVLNYIQENVSWELGFGIPCIAMGFALIVFLIGSMTYRFLINSDERNPFVRISRVFLEALRNRKAASSIVGSIEEEVHQVLPHEYAKLMFLDKAILTTIGSEENGNLCCMKDIGDAKAILRLVPIWSSCLGYAIIVAQSSTLFTKQGATMDRYIVGNFQIPSASLQSLISLSIIVFIPIYDRVLVPIASSIAKNPTGITMLQRIGMGIFLSFFSMVIAAFVEKRRLSIAIQHGLADFPKATIPMSVWWLAPQYLLYGIADVFAIVGLQEFFYDQIPGELKSIGLALYLSIFGIGNFLSSFLISIIEKVTSGNGRYSWFSNNLNRAHLDYFYWLLAGLSVVSVGIYVYFAKSYIYYRNDKI